MVSIKEVSRVEVASSSAGDHHRWKYDVFLSFRGEDTRKTFVDHLYSALVRTGICTFKDDERLETGESISPALLKAIEESSFAVIVFSKNYASSRWCLDELVKAMECSSKSPKGQTVIPIFYDVEPSDVRKQEGYFGEMFRKHDSNRVQIWRKTLTNATNLSGLQLNKTADGQTNPTSICSYQLEALAGSHEWFGPGSRIIITTRDRKLLVEHNEVQIYDTRLLDYVEATKLFRWKAFNDMCPAEDFEELSFQGTENIEGILLDPKLKLWDPRE
ncbi:hypothetical protein LguiB_020686 [Lonicera macranthoides]